MGPFTAYSNQSLKCLARSPSTSSSTSGRTLQSSTGPASAISRVPNYDTLCIDPVVLLQTPPTQQQQGTIAAASGEDNAELGGG